MNILRRYSLKARKRRAQNRKTVFFL